MPNKHQARIPVRIAPRSELIAEKQRIVQDYERRYGMPSAELVSRIDREEIVPTIEEVKWYHAYDALKFFSETTPMTGIPGTTTAVFTTAD